MKNKKIIFGMILFLFTISGLCSVISVSANGEFIYLQPSFYGGFYMGYLESGDQILINDIDSDGGINVYIMKKYQYDAFQGSGFSFSCVRSWENIVQLSNWRIDITDDDYYYVVLENDALITGRNVYVDLSVYRHIDTPDIRPFVLLIITIGIIFGVISIVLIILITRSKKKKRETQEVIKPKSFYCSNCGTENIDMTSDFCSKCGSKIIK